MSGNNKIRFTQIKSSIGSMPNHKANLRGLGLRRIGHTVELEDTASVRGMFKKVSHLVTLSET